MAELTREVQTTALNGIIPNGTARWLALLTTLPDADGDGAVEATGFGYARVSHSAWIDEFVDDVVYRKNDGTIEFAELTGDIDGIVGWALYDASTAGNLVASGTINNFDGDADTRDLRARDVPRVIDQELRIATAATSDLTWAAYSAAEANFWTGLAYSPSLERYVAVSSSGTNRVMTSDDGGETWTARSASAANTWNDVCWADSLGLFVAISNDGTNRVMTSPTGVTWTAQTSVAGAWQSICWSEDQGRLVAVANSGTTRVMVSDDGETWTGHSAAAANAWHDVIWADGISKYVAVSTDGTNRVMTSDDGETWVAKTAAAANAWYAVAWSYDLSRLCAVGISGANRVMTSDDAGETWTARTASAAEQWKDIVWVEEWQLFLAVGLSTANTMFSPDGVTWTTIVSAESSGWQAVVWAPEFLSCCTVSATGTNRVQVIGSEFVVGDTAGELDVVDEQSLSKLQALLPPGAAWNRDPGTEQTTFLRALSYEFSRLWKRFLVLLEELDPRTTKEMLEDHERVYGLPDECAQPDTIEGRRAALHGKMLGHLSPSIANIVATAASVGYTITITEYKRAQMFTCVSPCNAPLYTRQWMFVWTVTGASGDVDDVLECVLDGITPDHTLMDFQVA